MALEVYVEARDGSKAYPVRLAQFGPVFDVSCSTVYGDLVGGFDQASWSVEMSDAHAVLSLMRAGQRVTVWDSGARVWEGQLYSVLPASSGGVVEFAAHGGRYALGRFLALADVGPGVTGRDYKPTTVASTAIADAKPRGLSAVIDTFTTVDGTGDGIPTTAYSASDPKALAYISDVLVAKLREESKRACVWGSVLRTGPDDTTPTWVWDANRAVLGGRSTTAAGTVFVRYQETAPPAGEEPKALNMKTAYFPTLPRTGMDAHEVGHDVTAQGLMTTARAESIADALFNQVAGRRGLTGSLSFTDADPPRGFVSGGKAPLSMVRAGQMLRATNARSSLLQVGDVAPQDGIIGATQFSEDADGKRTLTVSMLESEPIGLEDILVATMRTARAHQTSVGEVPA